MNALRNRVQLIGNLGMNPEVKKFDNDRTMARFSIATTDSYKNNKGEKVEETQWHKIVAWGNLATLSEKYLNKGNEVALEGRLVHRSYEDKEGSKKYITEVVATEILFLRNKN